MREVWTSVADNAGSLSFLQGAGGTGKTFVENYLLAKTRREGKVALAVASSGIATILLQGGRTAHSRFKSPLQSNENTTPNISKNSMLAELLRKTVLIICDEAPMLHFHFADALNRCLQDVRSDTRSFGGATVVFAGDWMQTLPVVPRASPEQVVGTTLQYAAFWKDIITLSLTIDMPLQKPNLSDQQMLDIAQFAEWLKDVRSGVNVSSESLVDIPPYIRLTNSEDAFDGITQHCGYVDPPGDISTEVGMMDRINHHAARAILAARNDDVNDTNNRVLESINGEEKIYLSVDSINDAEDAPRGSYNDEDVSLEFLNSLEFPGLPLHQTGLKVGVPIILLRNLNPRAGLCNGTRMMVVDLGTWVIKARIMTGEFKGNVVLIPHIALDYADEVSYRYTHVFKFHRCTNPETLPFVMRRLQFPVKLAFAITVNKIQGQSLDVVALDLSSNVFTHGQLYVALSRATSANQIAILLPKDPWRARKTKNIVFREVTLA